MTLYIIFFRALSYSTFLIVSERIWQLIPRNHQRLFTCTSEVFTPISIHIQIIQSVRSEALKSSWKWNTVYSDLSVNQPETVAGRGSIFSLFDFHMSTNFVKYRKRFGQPRIYQRSRPSSLTLCIFLTPMLSVGQQPTKVLYTSSLLLQAWRS